MTEYAVPPDMTEYKIPGYEPRAPQNAKMPSDIPDPSKYRGRQGILAGSPPPPRGIFPEAEDYTILHGGHMFVQPDKRVGAQHGRVYRTPPLEQFGPRSKNEIWGSFRDKGIVHDPRGHGFEHWGGGPHGGLKNRTWQDMPFPISQREIPPEQNEVPWDEDEDGGAPATPPQAEAPKAQHAIPSAEVWRNYPMPGGTPRLGQDYTMPDKGWMIPPSEQFKDYYHDPHHKQFETDPGMGTRPRYPYYGEGGYGTEDQPGDVIELPKDWKRETKFDGIPARVITKTRSI